MPTFELTIDITAPVSVVWALNTEPTRWPELTPTVTSVRWHDDGPLRVGRAATVKQPGQKATVWTVTVLEPEQRFVWEASVNGVRTVATHLVELLAGTNGVTRNTLRLDMTGRGAGLFGALLGRRLRKILRTEADGFKAAAEAAR